MKPNSPLRGKTVAITGTLSIPREQFAILIEDAGGVACTSVSKQTDILIVGSEPGEGKLAKARENGTAIWDEQQARAVMDGSLPSLYTQKVYGSSDDLVELTGCVDDEMNVLGEEETFIRFTNGSYVKIGYTDEGIWRVTVITVGRAKVRKLYGMPDHDDEMNRQAHTDTDAPSYSDVLIIDSEEPIELEAWGHKPIKELPAGGTKARAIIKMLEGRRGFDDWWHDIEQDDKTEIMLKIAHIVEGDR